MTQTPRPRARDLNHGRPGPKNKGAINVLTSGLHHGNKSAKRMTQIPRPRARDLNHGSEPASKKKGLRKIDSKSPEKYSQATTEYYTDTTSSSEKETPAAYYDEYEYDIATKGKTEKIATTVSGYLMGATGPNQSPRIENFLTEQAWAEIPSQTALALKEEEASVQKKYDEDLWYVNNMKWDYNYWAMTDLIFSIETYYMHHICYQIASTYLHARAELHDYYRLRYAYNNKKEFEIGYVVHEIIYKYTTMLEIYHNVQTRFYNESRFSTKAPITFMLYMYGVTLSISQTIIHLCNILHEIESKYEFIDDKDGEMEGDSKSEYKGLQKGEKGEAYNKDAVKNYLAIQQKHKDKMKELQKKLRKEKKALLASGIFSSTTRTKRPYRNKQFPNHYGWSLENW